MGRRPCCDKVGLLKGPWSVEEDRKLISFILANGKCCWRDVPKLAGLLRCGKSCRLRWINYLRPDLKRGQLSDYEEKMVIDLHAQLGNKWSKIASNLPGRTDNEIKNHWHTHIKKKLIKMGIDPVTHRPIPLPKSPAAQHPEMQKPNNVPDSDQEPEKEMDHQDRESEISTLQSNSTDVSDEDRSIVVIVPDQHPIDADQEKGHDSDQEPKKEMDHQQNREAGEISTMQSIGSSSVEFNDCFSVNEVPMIEPGEILTPFARTSSNVSSASCSSRDIMSSTDYDSFDQHDQEILPTFDCQQFSSPSWCEYYVNNTDKTDVEFWDDDFISSLEMLMNGDSDMKELAAVLGVEP